MPPAAVIPNAIDVSHAADEGVDDDAADAPGPAGDQNTFARKTEVHGISREFVG